MRARNWLLLLPILMTSLGACESANHGRPLAVAVPSNADRKAAIQKQLAPMCAEPLSDDDLEKTAHYVETHRDAAWVIGRLDRMDRETRLCRGL